MISRREWLGRSLGAGAALALSPQLLRAFQQSSAQLIQRAIPSSGEMLPVIGLHRGSRPADPAALKEVLKTLVDNGGRVVDTVHGGDAAQQAMGSIANELGMQNRIFWSAPLPGAGGSSRGGGTPPAAEPSVVKARIEAAFERLQVPRIDLVMVLAIGTPDMPPDISTQLAVLREMKKEGRVRYIGVTDLLPPQTVKGPVGTGLESIMRNEAIDFVGFDYSVGDRRAEQTLLPLAQERKIGVMAYFPFDRARIFQRASSTPLPAWAADFDAKTWAQFFLKYVVSHPAITVVRAGTSNATHMLDDIGGGIGRLPNEATRRRMAEFVDALPGSPAAGPPAQQQAPQSPAGRAVGSQPGALRR